MARIPFNGDFKITQKFGNDLVVNGTHVYAVYGYKGHNGIDYGVPTGTNILAPHPGKVMEALFDPTGYGWYVKIENAIEGSILAHMMSLNVKQGDIVSEGQQVGISDNTGNSTGPHLHWGYYRFPRDRQNGYGGMIDQTPYIVTVSISDPTPTIPSGDQSSQIKNFLIEKGYTDPNSHFEVIKVMYESDLKLKSGNYILKEDCNKAKDSAVSEAVAVEKTNCATTQNTAVAEAVKNATADVESKYQDYVKVKDSGEYKFATFLFGLFGKNKNKELI